MCRTHCGAPPSDHMDLFRHVYRELNADADAKANLGRTSGRCSWQCSDYTGGFRFLRLMFDGSLKDGECGSGFVVFASPDPGPMDSNWHLVAWMSLKIVARSITAAELEAAAAAALEFVATLLERPADVPSFLANYVPAQYDV